MDVLEATATATVTDIPCENRGQFTPVEDGEQRVRATLQSSDPAVCYRSPSPLAVASDSTVPSDSVSGSEEEEKCVSRPEEAPMAASFVQVTTTNSVLSGEMTLASVAPALDTIAEEGQFGCAAHQCQEELSSVAGHGTDHSTVPEKTDSTGPLTPLTTDDSLSSSDDATADISQSSNADWEASCESPPLRRMSSASADSSTATISPSDTLAGASATDDSLSSDETAQDLSQNSLESTKCLSDLESVSVSSIVRRTEAYEPIDYMDDPSRRRVSFPMKDSDLVTGYMEPANPWESANSVTTSNELISLYKASCLKHATTPLECIVLQLKALDYGKCVRHDRLSLRETHLKPEACEALEEILKRVQYQTIDLTSCNLNDAAASAIFDMIEFYESAVELDVSNNPAISSGGFQSCVSMIRKSHYLRAVTLRGNPLSELHANNLGKAINMSSLHTLKLEHCGLTGRPLASLCTTLRNNKTLRELWLAHNDLYCRDADKIGELLKINPYIQFLDVSNNNLRDLGMKTIATALIQQATNIAQDLAKAIEAPLESVQRHESPDKDTTPKSDSAVSSESNSTGGAGGSRSMLDALLQMQPGECKEPVQTMNTISNNNVHKEQTVEVEVESKSTPSPISPCNKGDEAKPETVNVPLDSIAEVIQRSNSDIEITVSYVSGEETAARKDEGLVVVSDNNNVKEPMDEKTPAPTEPTSTTEPAKPYDLNDNKGGAENEALLINIMDDGANDKVPSNNCSPMPITRPSATAAVPMERQQKDDDAAYTTRSQSSDSLSSDNSLDAMETHLSAEIKEKITKNDTLGRQQKLNPNSEHLVDSNLKPPRGLQALILWDNNLTRASGEYVADMITSTNSLEILNIGKNTLSNDFISTISNSLKYNRTLTNLGLQSSHLNAAGIKILADVLHFGGNCTLDRIDIRDNNVQVEGLMALCDALKSNKSVTQIDIDDEPKRFQNDGDGQFHYSKYLHSVRSLFTKNQSTYEMPKVRNSRKISLTCQSIHTPIAKVSLPNETLDVKKKSGARLRSPLPSPPTISPSSSPVLSPSRPSRFQVSRVLENSKSVSAPPLGLSPRPDYKKNESPARGSPSPTSRFRVTRVKMDDYHKDNVAKADVNKSANVPVPVQNSTAELQFVFPEIVKVDVASQANDAQGGVNNSRALASVPTIVKTPEDGIDAGKTVDNIVQVTTAKPISIDDIKISLSEPQEQPIFEKVVVEDGVGEPRNVPHPLLAHDLPTNYYIPPAVEKAKEIPIYHPPVSLTSDTTTDIESPSPASETCLKTAKPEQRVRKSSWNTNYSTVEKFLTFFSFNRSTTHEAADKKATATESHVDNVDSFSDVLTRTTLPAQQVAAPTPGDAHVRDQNPSKTQLLFDVASKQFRDLKDLGKQVLKQNTTSVQSAQPQHQQQQTLQSPLLPLAGPNIQLAADPAPTIVTGTEEAPSIIIVAESGGGGSQQSSEIQEHSRQSLNSTACWVHSSETASSDKIMKLENNGQTALGEERRMPSQHFTKLVDVLAAQSANNHHHGQDNEKRDAV